MRRPRQLRQNIFLHFAEPRLWLKLLQLTVKVCSFEGRPHGCLAALAGDPNNQVAKAAVSVPERVRNYSKNLTLVALQKSEGNITPFSSDADHPVSMAWRSL